MRLTILGSGTSTGIPIVGCSCPVCRSTDPRDNRRRTMAVVEHGETLLLIDTGPDLRSGLLDHRISGVDGVLFTHTHADHSHGIDDLRPFARDRSIPVWADTQTAEELENRFAYAFQRAPWMDHPRLLMNRVHNAREVSACGALQFRRIPMLHGREEISGWLIQPAGAPGQSVASGAGDGSGADRGGIAWLCDASALPNNGREILEAADPDLLVIDGLQYSPHPTHFSIPEAVQLATELQVPLTVLTHFSHEVSHSRLAGELPEGIIPAFDGLQLAVGPAAK